MYRLVLYCLIFLAGMAFIFSFFNLLPFKPLDFLFTVFFLLFFSIFVNAVFAKVFQAPSNTESVYITALILALIINPAQNLGQVLFLFFLAGLAMASKYILAINKKHIFNPAAIAVVVTGLALGQAASWWIGNIYLMPFVLLTGILITRKIRRTDLVASFFAFSIIFLIINNFLTNGNILKTAQFILVYGYGLFMGFVMVTEPATTPPTKNLRIIYGAILGFLVAPFVHIAGFYFAPETALVFANVFSYIASPKEKLVLRLKEKIKVANDTFNFVFIPSRKLTFLPGQYLEWTLAHEKKDNRGMRRYFTIASSPTENEIIIGVKFYEKPSSFKKALSLLAKNETIAASQLAGDFILPKDKNKKLVFIAGGIGVTPFRSIIKYLIDKNEKRDIIIFYSNKTAGDVAYKEIFGQAQKKLGIKIIYYLTDESGFLNEKIIQKYAPDFAERMFYISGPRQMVLAFQKTLKNAGIHKNHIKIDFFPGFA